MPNKFHPALRDKIPNLKRNCLEFDYSNLEIIWYLALGYWNLYTQKRQRLIRSLPILLPKANEVKYLATNEIGGQNPKRIRRQSQKSKRKIERV